VKSWSKHPPRLSADVSTSRIVR